MRRSIRFTGFLPAAFFVGTLMLPPPAGGQAPPEAPGGQAPEAPTPVPKPPPMAVLKVSDDTWFRLGFLIQPQADILQQAESRGYAQNYFIRRIRMILGGSLVKDVTFFFETDAPNLGKSVEGKKTASTVIVQDGYLEWKIFNQLQLGGGRFLVPLARNTLQSAASLYALDYGSYSFLFSTPAQNTVGRDDGFHVRGYFLNDHLEYRGGIFQGLRDPSGRQAPRFMARLNFNLFDTETGYFYAGTNFGKKKILAFGGSYDRQKDYWAAAGDSMLDWPVPGGHVVTAQADYIHYDGGTTFTTLPKQDTVHFEGGFAVKAVLAPYGIFEWKDVADTSAGDEKRYGGGLAWFRNGHNFNVKAQYLRIEPTRGQFLNEFTVQVQGFFY
jgi:hypothetical protein